MAYRTEMSTWSMIEDFSYFVGIASLVSFLQPKISDCMWFFLCEIGCSGSGTPKMFVERPPGGAKTLEGERGTSSREVNQWFTEWTVDLYSDSTWWMRTDWHLSQRDLKKKEWTGHVLVSLFQKENSTPCIRRCSKAYRRWYKADGEGNEFKSKEKQQYITTAIVEMIEPS